jgi:hypothetical protein
MVYDAQKGLKHVAVVNGVEGPEYDHIVRLALRDEGVIEYLAVNAGNLYRVRQVPVEE